MFQSGVPELLHNIPCPARFTAQAEEKGRVGERESGGRGDAGIMAARFWAFPHFWLTVNGCQPAARFCTFRTPPEPR